MDTAALPPAIDYRRLPRSDANRRLNRVTVRDRTTLAEVIAWVAEHAAGVELDQITIAPTTLMWEDEATPEEAEAHAMAQAWRAARVEGWQREILDQLLTQFGVPEAHLPAPVAVPVEADEVAAVGGDVTAPARLSPWPRAARPGAGAEVIAIDLPQLARQQYAFARKLR